jgi:hypothetical protein
MWPFDYFKKKREKEEQVRLRAEEEARQRRLEQQRAARERERQLEENRRKERERQARLKAEREQQESIQPFTFKSNCHQRYENGQPVMGLQECLRTVSVMKNTNGCPGYKLAPGIGYIVKIYNDDLGKPNMSDKPMKVVSKSADKVELRGFPIEAQSPFGWQEVDYRDYGFVIYYKNGQVEKCVLHMYDRNIRLEYMIKSRKTEEPKKMEEKLSTIEKPSTSILPFDEMVSDSFQSLAIQSNLAFNMGNQSECVNWMNKLFDACYGRNGHKLLQITSSAVQPVGFAFTNIALFLDFNDEDLNSVAAENATYCLARSIIEKGNSFCTPPLFYILLKKRNLLASKLVAVHASISEKRVGMPIGLMLGGNPFTSPNLSDFREQATNEKAIDIMAYLLELFYDTSRGEYKVPTDLHLLLPSKNDIFHFMELKKTIKYDNDSILKEGQEYFYGLFSECQDTLVKMK